MSTNQDVYASLATRIKASIFDSTILLFLFISLPVVIGSFTTNESPIKAAAMFAPLLLLEPLLVTYFGATIGQLIFGAKVIRVNSRSKCPIYLSLPRYIAKILLGGLSLIYMLFSRKHQAIHDLIFGTIVLISPKKLEKNPELAKHGELEQIFSRDYIYPSAIRRFLIFILWYILTAIIIAIATEAIAIIGIQEYTIDSSKLPAFIEIALDIILAGVFITLAVLASKGYLPGARRKKHQPELES